jgi:hypothetical protein
MVRSQCDAHSSKDCILRLCPESRMEVFLSFPGHCCLRIHLLLVGNYAFHAHLCNYQECTRTVMKQASVPFGLFLCISNA